LEIIFDGITDVPDYQCRRLLHGRYHRLNPILPQPIGLDDVKSVPALVEIASQADLTDTIAWLSQYF